MRKVGEPSYKLDLHESSKVHTVFHVSCLKKVVGKPVIVSVEIPPMDDEGKRILVSKKILQTIEIRLRNRTIKDYLVLWKGIPSQDSTWENEHVLLHSGIQSLEEKNFLEGRVVMPLPCDLINDVFS